VLVSPSRLAFRADPLSIFLREILRGPGKWTNPISLRGRLRDTQEAFLHRMPDIHFLGVSWVLNIFG